MAGKQTKQEDHMNKAPTNTNPPGWLHLDRWDAAVTVGLFLASFGVYVITLAPSVFFGDSGELAAAAYNLGIAHPSGYPIYLLLGKLFMLVVPFGDMAYRMNLLSAFCAGAAVGMTYIILRHLVSGRLASAFGACILAFSMTFWLEATVTEAYTMSYVIYGFMLLSVLRWQHTGRTAWLYWLGASFGVAAAHHLTLLLFYPIIAMYIVWIRPGIIKQIKQLVKIGLVALAPLLFYVYLPIRSSVNPPNDWGNPETFSSIVYHVLGMQFSGSWFNYGLGGVLVKGGWFLDLFAHQFPWFVFPFVLVGAGLAYKKNSRLFWMLIGLVVVNILYSLAYYVPDNDYYFVHSYMVFVFFAAYTVQAFMHRLGRSSYAKYQWFSGVILGVIALSPLVSNRHTCDRSGNDLARRYAVSILESVEKDGVIFFYSEEELFTCAYLKIVEGIRPDVDLYDCKQNIFTYPIPKKQRMAEKITLAEASAFETEVVTRTHRPVYFSYRVRDDFPFIDYGVLYRVVRPNEDLGRLKDPWPHYESLRYLEDPPFYLDGYTAIVVGKIHLAQARRFWRLGDHARSDQYVAKALADAGSQSMVHKFAGYFFIETNRIDRAEQAMQRALELDPFISDSYNVLGVIAYVKGDLQRSIVHYSKALELDAKNLMSLHNRAMVYEMLGDRDSDPARKRIHYQAAWQDLNNELAIVGQNPQLVDLLHRIAGKLGASP